MTEDSALSFTSRSTVTNCWSISKKTMVSEHLSHSKMLCPYCLQRVSFKKVQKDGSLLITCPDPKCGAEVPVRYERDYDSFTPIIFSVVGFIDHGKSVYLASLLNEFERLTRSPLGFSYTALDEEGLKIVRDKQKQLAEGRLPAATGGNTTAKPIILQLEGMEELSGFRLLTYDIGGEVFRRSTAIKEYAGYVSRSLSVVWFISLADLEDPKSSESPADLDALIGTYVDAVLQLGGQSKDQVAIIVLTKGDKLVEKTDIPPLLRDFLKGERPRTQESHDTFSDELSDVIEQWLGARMGYQNFVRRMRKEFEQVKYCAVSATGSEPDRQSLVVSIIPRGVLEPLRWLLRQENARQGLRDDLLAIKDNLAYRRDRLEHHLGTAIPARLEQAISRAKEAIDVASMSEATQRVENVKAELASQVRQVRFKRVRRALFVLLLLSLGAGIIGWASRILYLRRQRKEAWYIREHLAELMLEGGEIELPAGEYRLYRSLRLNKPLSLKGSGKDTTKLECHGSLELVLASEGELKASDLTFEYAGPQSANVLTVTSGKTDLRRCRFTGGIAAKTQHDLGHGLLLKGRAVATIAECDFVRNAQHGVFVTEQAQVTIAGSSMQYNQDAGITYTGSASGTLKNSECHHNESLGIHITEQASPILEANNCRNNKRSGIGYQGNATGSAQDNSCLSNALNGISVEGFAQPTLQGNKCRGNEGSGILFSDNASGTARSNQCESNVLNGIAVTKNASPTLGNNISRNNTRSGIAYFADASGMASNNECTKNKAHGFRVEGRARPNLESNSATENENSGICYLSRAAGTSRDNDVTGNSEHGIIVRDQASPELESNRCEQNRGSGIAYFGYAVGFARKNRCKQNGAHGILVAGNANPVLEENDCGNNTSSDVEDWRDSTDILEEERPRTVSPPLPPD
jgi:parallel beta-helix repeat protein